MISETSADLWQARRIVVPVNTMGVMGAGVALEAKRRFPWCVGPYITACHQGRLGPRQGLVINNPTGGQNLVLVATKKAWYHDSTLDYVNSCLAWLASQPFTGDVSMPRIGCGRGGLDWSSVRPLVYQHLESDGFNVIIHNRGEQ